MELAKVVLLLIANLALITCVSYQREPIEIFTTPVGDGDATIIRCQNGDITILDMGTSRGQGTGTYITADDFIAMIKGLNPNEKYPMHRVENIFLTHEDEDHVSFATEVLDQVGVTKIFIGSSWEKFSKIAPQINPDLERLFMAQGYYLKKDNQGIDRKVYIQTPYCGHWENRLEPDWVSVFCEWAQVLNEQNDLKNTNTATINICRESSTNPDLGNWQITLMAANYGLYPTHNAKKGTVPNMNSLVLKLTPRQMSEPSMLFLGDFEDENPNPKEWDDTNYKALIEAGKKYKEVATDEYPQLRKGIQSDVLMVPHHGADTNQNGDREFVDVVHPTYSVISSNVQKKHPKCLVIDNLQRFSPGSNSKPVYCYDRDEGRIDDREFGISDAPTSPYNLYQTSKFIQNQHQLKTICTRLAVDDKGKSITFMKELETLDPKFDSCK